jgi:hypothetical protein
MVAETVNVKEKIPAEDDKDQKDLEEHEGGKKLVSLYTGKNQMG